MFNPQEVEVDDLANKIIFFQKNPKMINSISSKGKRDYFKKFNSNTVSRYIIEKTVGKKSNNKYSWK